MLALGIETATWMGSLALVDDTAGVIIEQSLNSRASHSERLLCALDYILKATNRCIEECSLICVSIGPGSFTGLRIGLATAKGLAYAADKPIMAIPTLEILAQGVPFTDVQICPVIDAKKKEVFVSLYRWDEGELFCIEPQMVVKPAALIEKITQKTLFVGDGLLTYGDLFKERLADLSLFAPPPFNFPRASIAAEIGIKRFTRDKKQILTPEGILPVYIRPSEAEINWGASQKKG